MADIIVNDNIFALDLAPLSYQDRGFLLADGLFETIKSVDGHLLFFEAHYNRLTQSAKTLHIPFATSLVDLKQQCQMLLERNQITKTGAVRITLTRGLSKRGIAIPTEQKPTLVISATPYTAPTNKHPSAYITSIKRNEHSEFTQLKTLNYLDSIMARKTAQDCGYDEGIMLNTANAVTETSVANLFIVTDNTVYTPKISDGALPGIVRQVILESAKQAGIRIQETTLFKDDLLNASEAFQTNSLLEIQSLSKINKHAVKIESDAEVTQAIRIAYEKHKKSL